MSDQAFKVSTYAQELAQLVDGAIETIAGERVAFVLVIFTEGRASYVSSASPEDMRRELTKLTDLWREGMPDVPAHRTN